MKIKIGTLYKEKWQRDLPLWYLQNHVEKREFLCYNFK